MRQQFKTLFFREFSNYFRSPLAYFVFFIYLFASIGSAFYFGSFLAMHDTSLYALFYAQPIILAVLLPSLTMKLWAEEYKQGTIELLLTQPVDIWVIQMAKYFSVVLFCFLMSLFLLPFIFYTSEWLNIDWQNILSDFLGLWLCMMLFCSIGTLFSAFTKNVIIAYLSSFAFTALWIILPFLGLYVIYNDFLFAELGLINFVYFASLSFVFCVITVGVIYFKYSVKKHRLFTFASFTFLMVAGGIFFNIAVYNFFENKIDFTESKLYTPKFETLQLLENVKEPVIIDVYASKEYINRNADYFHYLQQINRFLERYVKYSKGMISLNIVYVDPFSDLEEDILEKGLYFETNDSGSKDYLGAIVHLKDGTESIIKQFLLQRQIYLERDIDTALLKLIEPERIKNIGVYIDATQNLEGFQSILLDLENDYHVFNVSPSMYEFSDNVDALVIINPKSISPMLRYGIDQFLMRGGTLLVFFDFYTESQSKLVNEEDLQIVDFFNNWKINLLPEMTDEGVLGKNWGVLPFKLKFNKATLFKVSDDTLLKVEPFISADNGFIGAVLSGDFSSLYRKNPYENTEIFPSMKPFSPVSVKMGKVAVVGDVDFLEDAYWVANSSPDRNPYSVIESNGNGRAFKTLVDNMVGNEIYEKIPLNSKMKNRESISQKIKAKIFSDFEAPYLALQNKIIEQKRFLFVAGGEDLGQFEQILQVSEAGQNLARDEKKLQSYEYEMKNLYGQRVKRMMFWQILGLPLLLVLGLFFALKYLYNRYCKKIKETYHV